MCGSGSFLIMHKTVILSDNLPCDVRVLSLYALDHIGPHDIGDFSYRIKTLLGDVLDQIYPLAARLENPPPEPKPDTDDTWALTEWERYQAALAHNQKRHELDEERALNQAHEIITRCVGPADRDRIVTLDDYDTVYLAAVPEEVTGEALADVLANFFPGQI